MPTNTKIIQQQIDECVQLLKDVFGDKLLGIYLYGSSLLGGLQTFSDIDLFAITAKPTSQQEKEQLANALLKISGIYAVSKDRKPIELSIVVESAIKPWNYPPTFDFLYGDWLRKEFEAGNIEPWSSKSLPNLALVITQLNLSNTILFGPRADQLLPPIPYMDFFKATTGEIDSVMNDIEWDTRNVLLTLACVWTTLETNTIRSKNNAANWVIDRLPQEFKPVMQRAQAIAMGKQKEQWNDLNTMVNGCAQFILKKIKAQMEVIKKTSSTHRVIRVE